MSKYMLKLKGYVTYFNRTTKLVEANQVLIMCRIVSLGRRQFEG